MVLGLREQNMDMVADGINFDKGRIVVFHNPRNVGVEFAAFLIPEQGASFLRAEYEVNNDVGQGLGHSCAALTGRERFVGTVHLGLRSWDSLQPRLSHSGLSALTRL